MKAKKNAPKTVVTLRMCAVDAGLTLGQAKALMYNSRTREIHPDWYRNLQESIAKLHYDPSLINHAAASKMAHSDDYKNAQNTIRRHKEMLEMKAKLVDEITMEVLKRIKERL